MKYFSRKATFYANKSNDHRPIGLFTCAGCGAVVSENSRDQHEQWHNTEDATITGLSLRVEQLEARMSASHQQQPTVWYQPQGWYPHGFISTTDGNYWYSGANGEVTYYNTNNLPGNPECGYDCEGA